MFGSILLMTKFLVFILLIPQVILAVNKKELLASRTEKFGPSDYYIDLWGADNILAHIKEHGLTNKHALYVDSHGLDSFSYFVIRPDNRVTNGKTPPWYRIKDIANSIGNDRTNIHNLYFAACNTGNAFDLDEVRKHFPNATNIVHMPGKWKGRTDFFLDSIIGFPKDIPDGRYRAYWAELYMPGGKKPYRTVVANTSLLQGWLDNSEMFDSILLWHTNEKTP